MYCLDTNRCKAVIVYSRNFKGSFDQIIFGIFVDGDVFGLQFIVEVNACRTFVAVWQCHNGLLYRLAFCFCCTVDGCSLNCIRRVTEVRCFQIIACNGFCDGVLLAGSQSGNDNGMAFSAKSHFRNWSFPGIGLAVVHMIGSSCSIVLYEQYIFNLEGHLLIQIISHADTFTAFVGEVLVDLQTCHLLLDIGEICSCANGFVCFYIIRCGEESGI